MNRETISVAFLLLQKVSVMRELAKGQSSMNVRTVKLKISVRFPAQH